MYLQARFGAEQGAAVEKAIARRAEEVVITDDPYDRGGARTADALFELVSGGVGEAAPATVVIHADASVLIGTASARGPWLGETEDGVRLCSDAVCRLACDARIEWVLEREGRPVGIGRRGRVIPGAMARILRHRDQTCRFPGCERRKWLKAHHIEHWAHGGPTDLDNLVLLCHAHHQLIHEGGWRVRGDPVRGLRFHDPTGRQLRPMWDSAHAALADFGLPASVAG